MQDPVAIGGLALALVGSVAALSGFLWTEMRGLERRLRGVEEDLVLLGPFVAATRRKLQEDADRSMERLR